MPNIYITKNHIKLSNALFKSKLHKLPEFCRQEQTLSSHEEPEMEGGQSIEMCCRIIRILFLKAKLFYY